VARTRYSGRRDGVPSRVLNSVGVVVAVRGVARRWQGWSYGADSDGDGAAAGLVSCFDPA
jgi:hypothetical protein